MRALYKCRFIILMNAHSLVISGKRKAKKLEKPATLFALSVLTHLSLSSHCCETSQSKIQGYDHRQSWCLHIMIDWVISICHRQWQVLSSPFYPFTSSERWSNVLYFFNRYVNQICGDAESTRLPSQYPSSPSSSLSSTPLSTPLTLALRIFFQN